MSPTICPPLKVHFPPHPKVGVYSIHEKSKEVGQWGRGTGLLEAEGGVARQWTSRRCECGSWTPAPARGPVKCVCFLLACACNAEELSLNVKVPLDCLSFSLIPAMSL